MIQGWASGRPTDRHPHRCGFDAVTFRQPRSARHGHRHRWWSGSSHDRPRRPAQRRKRDEGKRDQHGEQRNGSRAKVLREPIGADADPLGGAKGAGLRVAIRCERPAVQRRPALDSKHSLQQSFIHQCRRHQSQFSPYLTAPADPASPIARIQDHVMAHIESAIRFNHWRTVVGMSTRNLARHFVSENRNHAARIRRAARIDAARMLLEGKRPASQIRRL